jgi:hypothetical protein
MIRPISAPKNYHPGTHPIGSTPHSVPPLVYVVFFMELKTLAKLDELHDELVKKSGVLEQEFAVLQQRIDALKAVQRKPRRAKK